MLYIATRSNIRVRVMKNGPDGFAVAWRDSAHSKRKRRSFSDYTAACKFADSTAERIADGNRRALTASDTDLAALDTAKELLAPFGVPLLVAVEEYKSARLRLGTMTISEAVTIAVTRNAIAAPIPPTPQLLDTMLSTLRKRNRAEAHIRNIAAALTPFAAAFPDLRAVSPEDVEDYLCSLTTQRGVNTRGAMRPAGSPVSTRTRDNVLAHVCTLFRSAKKHLPPPPYAPEEVPFLDKGTSITTFTPEQTVQVLDWFAAHEPQLVPYVALGAFAGLRTSEILRLEWSMLRWRTSPRLITIPASVAKKVNIPRKVEMNAALQSWLAPWAGCTSGHVIPMTGPHRDRPITAALARMRKALNWSHWDRNALRHSYASYRLSVRQDKAAVAIEMGTSPTMLEQHYNNPPNPEDATAYFAIMRETPTNVTALTA